MLSLLVFAVLGSTARAVESRALARALVGVSSDSRILIAPDSMFDQGQPTKFGDYRLVTEAEANAWAIRSGRHHFGPAASATLINTAQNQHAAGDPYRLSVSLPYLLDDHPRGGYQLMVRPTYQTLLMDPSLTSTKSVVQNALLLDVINTWHLDPAWEAGVSAEYRRDDATTRQSVGPFDADANKFSLRLHAVHRLGERRRSTLALDAGMIKNQARGLYKRYDRAEAELLFAAPLWWDYTFTLSAGAYRLSFPTPDTKRLDLNAHLSATARVPLGGAWAAEVRALYARNFGVAAPFIYDRLVVLTALTFEAPL